MFHIANSMPAFWTFAVSSFLFTMFLLPLEIMFIYFSSLDINEYNTLRPDLSFPASYLRTHTDPGVYSMQPQFIPVLIALLCILVSYSIYRLARSISTKGLTRPKATMVLAAIVTFLGFLSALFMNAGRPSWMQYYTSAANHTRPSLLSVCESVLSSQELSSISTGNWSSGQLSKLIICDTFPYNSTGLTPTQPADNLAYPFVELAGFFYKDNTLCSGFITVNNNISYACKAGIYVSGTSTNSQLNSNFAANCRFCSDVDNQLDGWSTYSINMNGSMSAYVFGFVLQVIAIIPLLVFLYLIVDNLRTLSEGISGVISTGRFSILKEEEDGTDRSGSSSVTDPNAGWSIVPRNPAMAAMAAALMEIALLIVAQACVFHVARFFVIIHFAAPLIFALYLYQIVAASGVNRFAGVHAVVSVLISFIALIYFVVIVLADSTRVFGGMRDINMPNRQPLLTTANRSVGVEVLTWLVVAFHFITVIGLTIAIIRDPPKPRPQPSQQYGGEDESSQSYQNSAANYSSL